MTVYTDDMIPFLGAGATRSMIGTPSARSHVDADGMYPDWSPAGRRQRGADLDQGDYSTLFEHLLPKPQKYPKNSSYGSVLRAAARASNPYQTMELRPERDGYGTYQTLPDRGGTPSTQTMEQRGAVTQGDLNKYYENLARAVESGQMPVERARSVWQAAVAAQQGNQATTYAHPNNPIMRRAAAIQSRAGPVLTPEGQFGPQPLSTNSETRVLSDGTEVDPDGKIYDIVNGERLMIGVNPEMYERGTPKTSSGAAIEQQAAATVGQTSATIGNLLNQPRNTPVATQPPVEQRRPAMPRTLSEAYQQAQAGSAQRSAKYQEAMAMLRERIGNRQQKYEQAMADLRSRLGTRPSMMSNTESGPPGDLEQWARQEAIRLKIDPDKAVAVANTEGGFADPVRQNMEGAPAYGPYQLYIGGKDKPGLGDEALLRGIDPRNPAHAKQAVTFALEHAAKNGWGAFQGAAKRGIGNWDGIGVEVANTTTVQQQQAAAKSGTSVWEAGKLTPNQLNEGMAQGLDRETALAVCGPAAAIAFARKMGRNPSLPEALEMAKSVGWTLQNGMAGPASQLKLLQKMGIQASLEEGSPNAQRVLSAVQGGAPVTISTPGHYFVAERYDPQTGKFDFGESARVLKAAKGNSWFTLDEVAGLGMGAPRAALYLGQ